MKDQKVAEVGEDVPANERDGAEVFPEDGGEEETNQEVHTENKAVERVAEDKFYFRHSNGSLSLPQMYWLNCGPG